MAALRPPADLGAAGLALWKRLTSAPKGETLVFSGPELLSLEMASKTADDIARLEVLLEAQGSTVLGAQGQVKLSSVLGELRLQRAALARLVAGLDLPEEGEEAAATPKSPRSRQAQKAAQARWANQARLAKVAKHGTDG